MNRIQIFLKEEFDEIGNKACDRLGNVIGLKYVISDSLEPLQRDPNGALLRIVRKKRCVVLTGSSEMQFRIGDKVVVLLEGRWTDADKAEFSTTALEEEFTIIEEKPPLTMVVSAYKSTIGDKQAMFIVEMEEI